VAGTQNNSFNISLASHSTETITVACVVYSANDMTYPVFIKPKYHVLWNLVISAVYKVC